MKSNAQIIEEALSGKREFPFQFMGFNFVASEESLPKPLTLQTLRKAKRMLDKADWAREIIAKYENA